MSKPVKLRGFGDPEVTERLKSKVSEDAMDVAWMAISDPMVSPSRVRDPVCYHIEYGVEDDST